MNASVAVKSLIDSVSSEHIEIAVKVEDGMRNLCAREVSELAHDEKHIQQDWTAVMRLGSEEVQGARTAQKLCCIPHFGRKVKRLI